MEKGGVTKEVGYMENQDTRGQRERAGSQEAKRRDPEADWDNK